MPDSPEISPTVEFLDLYLIQSFQGLTEKAKFLVLLYHCIKKPFKSGKPEVQVSKISTVNICARGIHEGYFHDILAFIFQHCFLLVYRRMILPFFTLKMTAKLPILRYIVHLLSGEVFFLETFRKESPFGQKE